MITPQDILATQKRISPYIRRTPVEFSAPLYEEMDVSVYLKLENLHEYLGWTSIKKLDLSI